VRETLIKLIYCEMLGHKVEFGYFFVVGLTQMQNRLVDKRIAYICGSLFLRPNDEMTCLWVNCFGRDLISQNKLEVEDSLRFVSIRFDFSRLSLLFFVAIRFDSIRFLSSVSLLLCV
jgi:AP-4 complex subunit epsilon-1